MPPTNMSATARQAGPIDVKGVRPTRVRHTVLWLTVLAYMVTYMDRAVIVFCDAGRSRRNSDSASSPQAGSLCPFASAMRCFNSQVAGSEIGLDHVER